MQKPLTDRFTSIRIYILKNLPFWGILSWKMPIVQDKNVKSACTNGKWIRINPEWAATLSNAELAFVWAHEISHAAFCHPGRLRKREAWKWSRACDYAINPLLIEAGLTMPTGVNAGLHNPDYAGLSADEIYLKLPDSEKNKGGNGFGNPDEHMEESGETATQDEATEKEWSKEIAKAAKAAEAWGKLGSNLSKLVDSLLENKVNWRAELAQFIHNRTPDDYSWDQPNRRYISQGMYLPRIHREQLGEIVIAIDTSGSTWDMQKDFMSEVVAVLSECKPSKTWVIWCDARIQKVEELDQYTPFKPASYGGGGTSFVPPFDFIAKEGIDPACMLYLTDLYGDFPESVPDYPVMWVTKGKAPAKPPFGRLLCIPADD